MNIRVQIIVVKLLVRILQKLMFNERQAFASDHAIVGEATEWVKNTEDKLP